MRSREQFRLTWGSDTAGWYWHKDWPVIWVDTPAGQKFWHVTPDLEDVLKRSSLQQIDPPGGYDGHERTLMNCRLARYITGSYCNILDQHYDERTEREKMEIRREFLKGV